MINPFTALAEACAEFAARLREQIRVQEELAANAEWFALIMESILLQQKLQAVRWRLALLELRRARADWSDWSI